MPDTREHGHNKTPVTELTLGMYVAKLDRPWLETSFELQGFYVRNKEIIDRLAAECDFVYVDPRLFKSSYAKPQLRVVVSNRAAVPEEPKDKECKRTVTLRQIAPRKPQRYEDSVDTTQEIVPAQTTIDHAIAIMEPIIAKVQSTGKLDVGQVEDAVGPLVSSVLRNKDAVTALLRIRTLDDYTYSHCISNAVWASVLGRHLGYTPEQINKLALGCALVDVGKVSMPAELLMKAGEPTDAEWEIIRSHVPEGLKILEQSNVGDRDVITMLAMHHERIDGSGYPRGLAGSAIPAYGQIAGIIDTYDAMITQRPYASAMTSCDAMHKLHEYAGVLFQEDLVEHLIRAIGVFPTGTVVELNTGEVGVVVAQNNERRLRPKVNLILDGDKELRNEPVITDLNALDTDPGASPSVWIKRELPQRSYGINSERYLV